jgi:hypothetical protein
MFTVMACLPVDRLCFVCHFPANWLWATSVVADPITTATNANTGGILMMRITRNSSPALQFGVRDLLLGGGQKSRSLASLVMTIKIKRALVFH